MPRQKSSGIRAAGEVFLLTSPLIGPPLPNSLLFQSVAENLAPIQRVSSKTRPANESTARLCASPITWPYFCNVIRESL